MSDPDAAPPGAGLTISEEAFRAWEKRVADAHGSPVCQVCGGVDWICQDHCFEAVEYGFAATPKKKPSTWKVLPMMVLVCTRCGNSLFINAIAAGIIQQGNSGAP